MLKCRWSKILTATALLLGAVAAEAKVEVAPVFSDNAVLQRRMAVPVRRICAASGMAGGT